MYHVLFRFNKNGYDLAQIIDILAIKQDEKEIHDYLKEYITKLLFNNDKLTYKKSKYNQENIFGYDLYEKNIYKESYLIIKKQEGKYD